MYFILCHGWFQMSCNMCQYYGIKWQHSIMRANCGRCANMFLNPDIMMTSSNGNIFRVTDPLCGEFTGPGEFPTQRPVTRSFDVFFDLRLNIRLSKHTRGWWFETQSWSLWRHCNDPASNWAGTWPNLKRYEGLICSLTVPQFVTSMAFSARLH